MTTTNVMMMERRRMKTKCASLEPEDAWLISSFGRSVGQCFSEPLLLSRSFVLQSPVLYRTPTTFHNLKFDGRLAFPLAYSEGLEEGDNGAERGTGDETQWEKRKDKERERRIEKDGGTDGSEERM